MNKNRWIEIKFLCFIQDLYNKYKNYIILTSYIEFLSELTDIDKIEAMQIVKKINETMQIRPSKSEFILLAKENKVKVNLIVKYLRIPMNMYYELLKEITLDTIRKPICNNHEISIMLALLEEHEKIRSIGL